MGKLARRCPHSHAFLGPCARNSEFARLGNSWDRRGSAHACHKRTWPVATCSVSKYKRHPEKPGRVVCSYVVSCYVCCYWLLKQPERRHCVQFLGLLAFSSSLLACAPPTMGSGNSAHSQTHQDNWHCEQDQHNTAQYPKGNEAFPVLSTEL